MSGQTVAARALTSGPSRFYRLVTPLDHVPTMVVIHSTASTSGPASVTAGTVTATSITVHWEEVPCLHHNGEITGYTVVATTIGEDDRVADVNSRAATVSGLNPNTQYSVSIAAVNSAGIGPATSVIIETAGESIPHIVDGYLAGKKKNRIILIRTYTDGLTAHAALSTDSLTFLWALLNGLTATAFTISYSNTNNTDCFTDYSIISDIAGSETMCTLTGLEEGTEYSITVTATLTGGRTEQDTITATTMAAGESTSQSSLSLLFSTSHTHSSICPSLFCESVSGELHCHHCPVGASGTL